MPRLLGFDPDAHLLMFEDLGEAQDFTFLYTTPQHHARHAGARAAKGEILIFTDDDAGFSIEGK